MAKVTSISGFPEFLPGEQIAFNKIVETIKHHFELAGALPLETPAVERTNTLLSKGGDDKEIYGLRRLAAAEGEQDAKDLALRFDLTVPLARYVSQHYGQLTFPFKRYQIQPVWRGERAQAGRYRQFYQCDIDVIGENNLSLLHDAEIPAIMCSIFKALDIGNFTLRLNNRKVLQGLLAQEGLTSDQIPQAIGAIDKMEKVPTNVTLEELGKAGVKDAKALLSFFTANLSADERLAQLKEKASTGLLNQGVEELETVVQALRALGVDEPTFTIDLAIARGLDYYTGTVYETRLEDFPALGSICSGGRYDNLTDNFTNKNLPGVGMSIGLSRLMTALLESNNLNTETKTTADVLVTAQNPSLALHYLQLGQKLRAANIKTEVFLETRKLDKQMKYAAKKGFKVALIADEGEKAAGTVIVRNLATGEQKTVPEAEIAEHIQKIL